MFIFQVKAKVGIFEGSIATLKGSVGTLEGSVNTLTSSKADSGTVTDLQARVRGTTYVLLFLAQFN